MPKILIFFYPENSEIYYPVKRSKIGTVHTPENTYCTALNIGSVCKHFVFSFITVELFV